MMRSRLAGTGAPTIAGCFPGNRVSRRPARRPALARAREGGHRLTPVEHIHSIVRPVRVRIVHDHSRFFEGDELYLLTHQLGLPAGERTLGERMQEAGYVTGYVGKWHLGWEPQQRPHRRGFDEHYGIEDSGTLHVAADREGVESWTLGEGELPAEREKPVYRGDQPVEEGEHLADAWTREALAFLDRHHDQPFFLFVAYNQPHTPLQATAPQLEPYPQSWEPARRIYAAMVSAVDAGIGAMVSRLASHGLERDTLIVFLSDNGCTDYLGPHCSNRPLAGGKRSHQEGGVRVPFLLSWPAGLSAGVVYEEPVSSLDLVPTILAAAGAGEVTAAQSARSGDARPAESADGALDGVDLLPYLRGERDGPPHRRLFWRTAPNRAIREGPYKLWQVARTTEERFDRLTRPGPRTEADRRPGPPLGTLTLLYDLRSDPGEQTNLAALEPEVVDRLIAALDAWESELAAPSSPKLRRSAIRVHGEPVELVF